MLKPAETSVAIDPLLAGRWSPRTFDASPLAGDEVTALLEAARWAASCANAQPWRFIVGLVGDATHAAILDTLMGFNRPWADAAPMLVVGVAMVRTPEGKDWAHGTFDLGASMTAMTLQAVSLGLVSHQVAGFDVAKAVEAFSIPEGFRPMSVATIGRLGDVDALPDDAKEREAAPRVRKPLSEIAFTGGWGIPIRP